MCNEAILILYITALVKFTLTFYYFLTSLPNLSGTHSVAVGIGFIDKWYFYNRLFRPF